jgi:hypothetical protein
MRAIILAAVIGLGSALAFAGPSDHASRRFGDYSTAERPELRTERKVRTAPYDLTGERVRRRVVEFRDVPKGHGQTERIPFWIWVTE